MHHVHEIGCQLGVRSCSMTGLPRHLAQELNVGTVDTGEMLLGGGGNYRAMTLGPVCSARVVAGC